jgi:hypothetical protein
MRTIKGFFFLLGLGLAMAASGQTAGEVEFSRGVGFAQMQGQMPRTLGKGLQLNEGDRLTTSEGAAAIVKMQDGTRLTLRPNSELIVQQFQYKEGSTENSMVMQLLRGGFRAITGFIAKGGPNAAKVHTSTSTIGIRGTDFDARICGADCRGESAKVNEKAKPNAVLASAKMVSVFGEIYAIESNGVRRRAVEGASVYAGDSIETSPGAKVVLVFRDESRLTLGSNTRFKVDSFVFDSKNPGEGQFLVTLLKGTLRALTGIIGKSNHSNVGFITPTATVGIRGTGLDLDCGASDSCSFFTWLGTIEVKPAGGTAIQTLQAGQGLFVGPTGIRPLTAPTLENLPRPDSVPVNVDQLFTNGTVSGDEEGLYVFVRDGHIEVTSPRETLHLGRGETGFAGRDGITGRPMETPLFIQFDKVPLPNNPNPAVVNLMSELGSRPSKVCR